MLHPVVILKRKDSLKNQELMELITEFIAENQQYDFHSIVHRTGVYLVIFKTRQT